MLKMAHEVGCYVSSMLQSISENISIISAVVKNKYGLYGQLQISVADRLWSVRRWPSPSKYGNIYSGKNTHIDPEKKKTENKRPWWVFCFFLSKPCNWMQLDRKNHGILGEIYHPGSIRSCTHLHDTKGRFLFHLNPHDEDLGHGNPGTESVFFGRQWDSVITSSPRRLIFYTFLYHKKRQVKR